MDLSVVLSTYNAPSLLDKDAAAATPGRGSSDFELVIADDGSGPETGRSRSSGSAR